MQKDKLFNSYELAKSSWLSSIYDIIGHSKVIHSSFFHQENWQFDI
jgi:hypothetical protein